jgi:LPXTG-site transpeptidase (sortase) family protein
MTTRNFLPEALCVLACILLGIASLTYHKAPRALNASVTISAAQEKNVPVRLTIPIIGVNAKIDQVGLTPSGAMDAPKGPDEAAWFALGPTPGNVGSAVIAGHYGWKNGKAAVFDKLNTLHKGDIITVESATGSSTSFVVRELRTYDARMDATDVFTSKDGAHLNLITCIGTWDASEKSYSKRIVVFTDVIANN